MPGKEKELVEKTPALKGTAADIFANLKGVVAKTAIQKILVNLAEKGEITQKAYGKVLIFVAKQADLGEMPPETSEALGAEEKGLITTNNELTTLLKTYNQELNCLRSSPTDSELETSIQEAERTYTALIEQLHPLRSGQPLVTAEELLYVNAEWARWRAEWVKRRKIFYS
ncbi:hypothetical protein Clacol_002535 [Clathrus columnatus]|uniref:Homologous-pairing protein 2 winged helix domain-containing protein n=1 Tax=Clathrus columnatus TaxID=1419009 RepID=A0AAV5A134_9AGAM|nr:hypothetical protein Clacol_002535 [Clathrus columnatus]